MADRQSQSYFGYDVVAGSLQDRLLNTGFVNTSRKTANVALLDEITMNRMILVSWPFFSLYLLTQPLLSNWFNNKYDSYTAEYDVFARTGSLQGSYTRPGMCDTPAEYFHCTDGQNFTELALKYRGAAVGCGCGQGFLGEGLCPMTSYGYTLSDFVNTEPGIALMLGLGFFPLLGTWRNTMMINRLAKPSRFFQLLHMRSMGIFQISYLLWGIASDCIFPTAHSVLTVIFLGSFLVHWVVTALICIACMGIKNVESIVTIWVAAWSVGIISLGAIPRVLLTLNSMLGITWFWNLNYGFGSYAFWLAEAGGLSLTFGAYPLILVAVYFFPDWADVNNDGELSDAEKAMFALFPDTIETSEENEAAAEFPLGGFGGKYNVMAGLPLAPAV